MITHFFLVYFTNHFSVASSGWISLLLNMIRGLPMLKFRTLAFMLYLIAPSYNIFLIQCSMSEPIRRSVYSVNGAPCFASAQVSISTHKTILRTYQKSNAFFFSFLPQLVGLPFRLMSRIFRNCQPKPNIHQFYFIYFLEFHFYNGNY